MKREDLKSFFKNWYEGELEELDASESRQLLLEQEEDLFGDEEEEPADEGGEEGEEEEPADEEGEEEVAEVEVEEVAIEAGDEVRLGKQFDIALDSILADYEMNALKSAQIHTAAREEVVDVATQSTNEWWNRDLGNLLFEQDEAAVEEEAIVSENELDIDLFSEDVARLIKNYTVLMDMESIIFNKAKEFLMQKYGDEVAAAFAEILRLRHDMDFDSEIEVLEDIEIEAPLAVGAGGGGAGGAV
jgi:hypothetical protein